MSRVMLNPGSYTMQLLEGVYAYRPWIRVMHSLNKFDMLSSVGDMKVSRDLRSGAVLHEGFLRTKAILKSVDPVTYTDIWVTLTWRDSSLKLALSVPSAYEGELWDSGLFMGGEYIGHVLYSMQNWLDSAGYEVV